MFQATRRRLALWYTGVTAILLLLFASGFYLYVRSTLVERIDDTLNHVVEVVERSLVIEPAEMGSDLPVRLNLDASFRNNAEAVEDDHIDLEWFSPTGDLLWSTFSQLLDIPLHISNGETIYARMQEAGVGSQESGVGSQPSESPPSSLILDPSSLIDSASFILPLRQVTQRVEVGRQVLGYLRVSHPWFEVTKPSRQLIRDLAIGTGLMVGAIAAIGWFLSGLAMAPVYESYQRLKQFTADASHELRNPIAVIQTNVQVALADPDPDLQFQHQQLKVIERLTRRLGRLVDDLLFLARQDSGVTVPKTDKVVLDKLLLEVVEEQGAIAAEKHISLQFQTHLHEAEQLPFLVLGDRDQLIRLFTNVISNAIQYTPSDGTVQLQLQRIKVHGATMLQVTIQDTGIGIPADAIPHLFDRFYRVNPARSRTAIPHSKTESGSGLGLAIAKVITENHHGQIQVESKSGHGSIFTVLLPAY